MAIPSNESPDRGLNPGNPIIDSSRVNRWLLLATLALVLAVGGGLGYVIHERENTARLALANSVLTGQATAMRSQMQSLRADLKALTAPVPPAPAPPAPQPWRVSRQDRARLARSRRNARRAPLTDSKSQRQIKQELLQQEKRLTATKEELVRTRAALNSAVSSTHGLLSGLGDSIARNHAELVALERLGVRGYYEFDLSKSKRFEREGPIGISLRHTNTKHKNYNVVLLVDDYQLSKKNVDLYEPITL
ncbi:MAG: hypothetical protein ACRD10_03150, partial [Terriglobia bacterium]